MTCKQHLNLRCVLPSDPSPSCAGVPTKTRLESSMQKFKLHACMPVCVPLQGCSHGVAVDMMPFDGAFVCSCDGTVYAGTNCQLFYYFSNFSNCAPCTLAPTASYSYFIIFLIFLIAHRVRWHQLPVILFNYFSNFSD